MNQNNNKAHLLNVVMFSRNNPSLHYIFCLVFSMVSGHSNQVNADASTFADYTPVIGHRGLGAGHIPEPENSISSMVTALRMGASAVELDAQLTADGVVVLAHDAFLDRMTIGHGCVSETNFSDIHKLLLRTGGGSIYHEKVASLDDVLAEINKSEDRKSVV